jgi:hypothetical protein
MKVRGIHFLGNEVLWESSISRVAVAVWVRALSF